MGYYLLFALLIIALFITGYLFVVTVQRYDSKKKLYFLLLMGFSFIFLWGYLFEITSSTRETAFLSVIILHMGGCFVAPLYCLFILDYCEYAIPRWLMLTVLWLPIAGFILIATSGFHSLYYASYYFSNAYSLPHFHFTPGPLYYAHHAYQYCILLFTYIVLLRRHLKWSKNRRRQTGMLLLSAMPPFITNILYALWLKEYGLNLTPISMVVVAVIFYIAITKYNMFDIEPKATQIALEAMKEALVVVDGENRFMRANAAAYHVFPQLKAITPGMSIEGIHGWPRGLRGVPGPQDEAVEFSVERDGTISHYAAGVSEIALSEGGTAGWVFLIQNNTETKSLITQLQEMAFRDALTGLFNRRHFLELAEDEFLKASRYGRPFSILMADIDHFKAVNDTYGHAAGDEVLKALARIVAGELRAIDIFARYGGEEFVILLPETDPGGAKNLAERVRAKIAEADIRYEAFMLHVTVSFGVATRTADTPTMEKIIQNADEALYDAKRLGRNRVEGYNKKTETPGPA